MYLPIKAVQFCRDNSNKIYNMQHEKIVKLNSNHLHHRLTDLRANSLTNFTVHFRATSSTVPETRYAPHTLFILMLKLGLDITQDH